MVGRLAIALMFLLGVANAAPKEKPEKLLKDAQTLEQQDKWDEARDIYRKLEKDKAYRGKATYLEARAACQMGQNAETILLVQQAMKLTGVPKDEAMTLYGDALFRNGDIARAKEVYRELRKRMKGEPRVALDKKIMAANTKLHLP